MPSTKYDPMFEESKFSKPDHHFQDEEEDTSDRPTLIDRSTTFRSQPVLSSVNNEDNWFYPSFPF
jgi:hypothetical protein